MKKVLFISISCLLLLSGCKSKKQKLMVCTRSVDQAGIVLDLEYRVKYTGSFVDSVESVEKVISEDSYVLESYKEQVLNSYSPYQNLKYYDYDVSIDGNTLTSTLNINYKKINTKKMIDIDPLNSELIQNGKLNVDMLEASYKTFGVVCTK